MKIKIFSTIIAFFIFCFLFYNQTKTYSGLVFGTYYNIKVRGYKNVENNLNDVFNIVNKQMSVFIKNSDINKINNNKSSIISAELAEVLRASEGVFEKSGGFFDPSVGPLIELWGFGVNKEKKVPSKKEILETIKFCGFDKITIDGNNIKKKHAKTTINLSAIAKGYAVDEVAKMLDKKGFKNYLIDIGGEVKAKGKKTFNKSWKIGLANPIKPEENQLVFELNDMSVATSGDYQNYFEKNGKKYSHTINPKTGEPTFSDLISVSVFNKSCMMADAYATAIMAMGSDKAIVFIKKHKIKALLIKNDGNLFRF